MILHNFLRILLKIVPCFCRNFAIENKDTTSQWTRIHQTINQTAGTRQPAAIPRSRHGSYLPYVIW